MGNGLSSETHTKENSSLEDGPLDASSESSSFYFKAPDLSDIPDSILHTATVEALISQNEDLMAHIKVHIRRDILLEQEILTLQKRIHQHNQSQQNQEDRSLIWKEKDRAWKEKLHKLEVSLKNHHTQSELTEVRYAELYEAFQQKQKQLSEEKKTLRQEVEKKKAEVEIKKIELSEQNKKLQRNITSLTEHITNQKKKYERDQNELTSIYEKERTQLSGTVKQLTSDTKYLRERVDQLEPLVEEKVLLNNQIILAERGKSEITKQLNVETKKLQEQVAFYRKEAKIQALELNALREKNSDYEKRFHEMRDDQGKNLSQIESLQLLWKEKHGEIEKLQEKNKSLNNINSHLSKNLSDLRKESESSSKSPSKSPSKS